MSKDNNLKKSSTKIKNSIVMRLIVTVTIIFISMIVLWNFMINIYMNNFIKKLDIKVEGLIQGAKANDLYLVISEEKIKSTFEFKIYVFFMMIFILLCGSLILYFVISHMMKPLKSLTEQISEIDINNIQDLSREIVATKGGYEIEELKYAFNATLKKLYNDYERQKEFSANVAHELRTPLAILYSKIDVFNKKDNRDMSEYKKLVSSLRINIERLSDLVEKILLLTNKQNNIKYTKLCLNDIVDEIILDLEGIAEEKNIIINVNDNRVIMYTNDALIERVLFNIIENAIKYNVQDGSVHINLLEEDSNVIIEVIDTGIGISDNYKDKVFDIFYRIEESRNHELGGYGIGLALAHNIVTTLGGKIYIIDNKPKGTIIKLKFRNSNDEIKK
ncbi:hypothetical protein Z968_07780 [Clostridium novyi A str. 4552]|uniref:histidine kinase n=1 Tax=Clostridium novyi A str. 4552 TaxID=1444289 RepID=A0A0A0I544_CLONO|nr:HAMP domain-containing sensor histidine kinase [Clostridium novyi]KGM95972.1 hypothetical protein Z968_07780 [Clostridium novyi A str. 4552]